MKMRDFHLRFALNAVADLYENAKRWYDNDDYAVFDLVRGEAADVPDEPGAYVLGTADNTMLVYPWGLSPVYYIGKAKSLRARLSSHCKHTLGAMDDHSAVRWWPRYQYGAAFGAHAVWYLAVDVEPQNVEATLISSFYDIYGSIPVANARWPKWLEVSTPADDE